MTYLSLIGVGLLLLGFSLIMAGVLAFIMLDFYR